MTRYASETSVAVSRSKAEIEQLLTRYGASSFVTGWEGVRAALMFEINQRRVRIVLPLPNKSERRFTHTPGRDNPRRPEDAEREWEQGCRQAWRALLLVVKAKLEAVASGIATFEQEFLAYVVLPNGKTVGEHTIPSLTTGAMPPLLPGYTGGDR